MLSSTSCNNPPTLLVVIIDLSPPTWGHRSIIRSAKDKALAAKQKPSGGPAILDDVINSSLAFLSAFCCMNRENVCVVIGVTDREVGVIYPRKGGDGAMHEVVYGSGGRGERVDRGLLNDYIWLGSSELVNRAAERREKMESLRQEQRKYMDAKMIDGNESNISSTINGESKQCALEKEEGATIAAAISLALCIINRFMVASDAGVSALSDGTRSFQRRDDAGILALMNGVGGNTASGSSTSQEQGPRKEVISPRILILQCSQDRTADYNALMNCAFAANKQNITIDGCFIPSGRKEDAKSSPYLEQIVHQTSGSSSSHGTSTCGGIYLSVPGGAAQVNGALSEVLLTVFLSPLHLRKEMNLPKLTRVDFRARCFETGESIDVGKVCNQCLSIFKKRPREYCWTCGANVRKQKEKVRQESSASLKN